MMQNQLEAILQQSLNDFEGEDGYLLEARVQEQCVAHKFAEHIGKNLRNCSDAVASKLSVDCEYNRIGLDKKKVVPEQFQSEAKKEKTVRPDVVVHERGSQRKNLLAIEIKLTSNASPTSVKYAKWKLRTYKRHLSYEYALYICFLNGNAFTSRSSTSPCYSQMEWL